MGPIHSVVELGAAARVTVTTMEANHELQHELTPTTHNLSGGRSRRVTLRRPMVGTATGTERMITVRPLVTATTLRGDVVRSIGVTHRVDGALPKLCHPIGGTGAPTGPGMITG